MPLKPNTSACMIGCSQASNTIVSKTQFHEYEFGGVPGAWGMMLGLPVGVYALTWAASKPTLADVLTSLRPSLATMLKGQLPIASKGLMLASSWFGLQVGLGSSCLGVSHASLRYRCLLHTRVVMALLVVHIFDVPNTHRACLPVTQLFIADCVVSSPPPSPTTVRAGPSGAYPARSAWSGIRS